MILFALVALAIAVSDQLLKSWIVGNYNWDTAYPVVGNWFRIHPIQNGGGLFGLFQGSAPIFALVTLGVVAVLATIEFRTGWRSWLLTITLSLLLGGAIGNFVDRLRFGYVVDFADIGIGANRFYIFNIADSAVTTAIILMVALWLLAPYLGIHMPGDGDERHAAEAHDTDSAGAR